MRLEERGKCTLSSAAYNVNYWKHKVPELLLSPILLEKQLGECGHPN
ncbi:MAG TPA: hypothetical protein V6D35_16765 [Candidatus Sericytochromatia bacterium]